jgi:hypothetical protein
MQDASFPVRTMQDDQEFLVEFIWRSNHLLTNPSLLWGSDEDGSLDIPGIRNYTPVLILAKCNLERK